MPGAPGGAGPHGMIGARVKLPALMGKPLDGANRLVGAGSEWDVAVRPTGGKRVCDRLRERLPGLGRLHDLVDHA